MPKRPNFSPEEAADFGKKGGVNSGASRRKKKAKNEAFREMFKEMLAAPVTSPKHLRMIEKSGMPIPPHPTYKDFMVANMTLKAIQRGSLDDVIKLMDIIGEAAGDVEITNKNMIALAELLCNPAPDRDVEGADDS